MVGPAAHIAGTAAASANRPNFRLAAHAGTNHGAATTAATTTAKEGITAMFWSWLVSPLGLKIGAVVIGVAVLGASIRYWGNHQWEEGQIAGRAAMSGEIQKAANQARQQALDELATERASIDAARAKLDQQAAALQRERIASAASLNARLAAIENALQRDRNDVQSIPAGDLPDRIRAANLLYRARR